MSTPVSVSDLWDMLETLAADLESTVIRVPSQTERAGDSARRSLLADVRRYFGPRLAAPAAPLVIGVLGPSGAGVSTVVNALTGADVSPAGVLRPTTKRPRLWAPHAGLGRWWDELKQRLEVTAESDVVVKEAGAAEVPWVVIDIPAALGPSESLDLAACADVCVFVNSPSRYADAEAAALAVGLFERGVPTWYVLNKLPSDPALRFEIAEAYAGLLHSWDLLDSPTPEAVDTALWTSDGPIDETDLRLVRGYLDSLQDLETRRHILEDALAARLAAVSLRAEEVAESIEDDRDSLMELDTLARDAYTAQADRLVEDLDSGEFAGLADHSSWPEAAVDLTGIVTRRAGLAAHRATAAWEATPAGRAVLADGGGALRRHGEQAAFDGQGLLEAWLHELGDEAAAALEPRRVSARKRARLANMLWRQVVAPEREAPRRLTRRLGDKAPAVVSEGRVRLGIAMVAAVARDADRFDDFLGAHPEVGRLGRIITTASVLGDLELTDVSMTEAEPSGKDSKLEFEIVIDEAASNEIDTAETGGDAHDLVAVSNAAAPHASEHPAATTAETLDAPDALDVAQPQEASQPAASDGSRSADASDEDPQAGASEDGTSSVVPSAAPAEVVGTDGVMTSSLPEVPVFELPEMPPPPPGPPSAPMADGVADDPATSEPSDNEPELDQRA